MSASGRPRGVVARIVLNLLNVPLLVIVLNVGWRFAPFLLGCVVLWIASARPVPPWTAPFLFEGADKIVHAGAYGLLALLALRGVRGRLLDRASVGALPWLAAWVLAIAYGSVDELHQSVVPGRSADGWDLLADAIGAAAALAVVRRWGRRGRPDPRIPPSHSCGRGVSPAAPRPSV